MLKKSRLAYMFFTCLVCCFPLQAQESEFLQLDPPAWKFGTIDQGASIEIEVHAKNTSGLPLTVNFISTCACLEVDPGSRIIPAGETTVFKLRYDSSDDSGITRKGYVVSSDRAGEKPRSYLAEGIVQVRNIASGGPWIQVSPGVIETVPSTTLTLLYYFSPGCRSCTEFLDIEIPRLEKKLSIRIAIQRRDILEPDAYKELSDFASSLGRPITAVPAIRAGKTLLQGEEEIRQMLPAVLEKAISDKASETSVTTATSVTPPAEGEKGSSEKSLSLVSVMLAGLVDGVNPCAFTTLIFLLASLALAGKGRKDIALIGALFTLGVFLTYLAVGFGFFTVLRAANGFSLVSALLRWILVAALLVFAGLSVYDFFLIKAGRSKEILLQLPGALKNRIHASIRTRVRTATLAGSSLTLGFLVSIFEFACTGQVYLPTLAYMVRVSARTDSILMLILYNICFIAPLLAVFAASYLGVGSKIITELFQKHLAAVKLGLAFVFILLAALTIVG